MAEDFDEPIQPNVSPDGTWVWDGHNWVPNPHPTAPQAHPNYPPPFPPAAQEPSASTATPTAPRPAPGLPPPPRPGQIASPPPVLPAKRSNVLRNIVLSCVVLSVLMVGGCAAFIAIAVKEVGDEVDRQVSRAGGDGTQGQQVTVQPGDSFDLDGLRYRAGWKLTENEIGMLQVKNLRFENSRSEEATVVLRLEVLQGDTAVATVHCTSGQVPPDTLGRLECLGADQVPQQYDEVRVTDLF